MTENEVNIVTEYIMENVEIIPLSDEYFYAHLPLCIIDAVYSIGSHYSATKNVVARYCENQHLLKFRVARLNNYPPTEDQQSIVNFLNVFPANQFEFVGNNIFQNRQRTSTRNGILKAEAVFHFATVLSCFNVNYFKDVVNIFDNVDFKNRILQIRGQKSGLSLDYFFMLCGNGNYIKVDRMIMRFFTNVLNRQITDNEIKEGFPAIIYRLQNAGKVIDSATHLDHSLWAYQRQNID